MSQANNTNELIFFATVMSKISQMFTEINSIYLQAMLNKDSVQVRPQYNVSTLFHQLQKKQQQHNANQIHIKKEDDSSKVNPPKEDIIPKPIINEKKMESSPLDSIKPQKKIKEVSLEPPHPPPSSYLLFFNQHRSKIAEQYPNLSVAQLSKIGSKCWLSLTEEEKRPYHQRFNKEKQKYYEALNAYNQSKGLLQPAPLKKRGRKPKKESKCTKQGGKTEPARKPEVKERVLNHANDSDSQFDSSLQI